MPGKGRRFGPPDREESSSVQHNRQVFSPAFLLTISAETGAGSLCEPMGTEEGGERKAKQRPSECAILVWGHFSSFVGTRLRPFGTNWCVTFAQASTAAPDDAGGLTHTIGPRSDVLKLAFRPNEITVLGIPLGADKSWRYAPR
jgi:hypothetical protein